MSEYPKLTTYITPQNKARLKAVSTLLGIPEWQILGESFETYWKSLPPRDRKLADEMARRILAQ